MEELFHRFDTDGSGEMGKDELQAALKALQDAPQRYKAMEKERSKVVSKKKGIAREAQDSCAAAHAEAGAEHTVALEAAAAAMEARQAEESKVQMEQQASRRQTLAEAQKRQREAASSSYMQRG